MGVIDNVSEAEVQLSFRINVLLFQFNLENTVPLEGINKISTLSQTICKSVQTKDTDDAETQKRRDYVRVCVSD